MKTNLLMIHLARQEELWGNTNVDARQQLAAREGALRYKRRFLQTIEWFDIVEVQQNSPRLVQ
jgi:hypothetical protein